MGRVLFSQYCKIFCRNSKFKPLQLLDNKKNVNFLFCKVSGKSCNFNILNYCSDIFKSHSLAEDLCGMINKWINGEIPQASSLSVAQLQNKLKLAQKPPLKSLTRSSSILNALSKFGTGSYKSCDSTVFGKYSLFLLDMHSYTLI